MNMFEESSGPSAWDEDALQGTINNDASIVADGESDYENEPPLLEELGIDFQHIWVKVSSVLWPFKSLQDNIMDDADLAGPLVFCLLLGFCLLLTGKIHFGYIYGFGAFGCLGMYSILNLMAKEQSIDLSRTFSVLGYCLLPIVALAAVNVFVSLQGWPGTIITLAAIGWCTQTSTRFFEKALHMTQHRWLFAYPAFLLYACFAMITIF